MTIRLIRASGALEEVRGFMLVHAFGVTLVGSPLMPLPILYKERIERLPDDPDGAAVFEERAA